MATDETIDTCSTHAHSTMSSTWDTGCMQRHVSDKDSTAKGLDGNGSFKHSTILINYFIDEFLFVQLFIDEQFLVQFFL